MSDQLIGKKGSDYPKLEDFTEEQRTAFLGSTLVHAIGKLNPSDISFTDANLELSDLKTDQIQADWNEQDSTKVSYIKNKPTIPSIEGLATEAELSTVSGEIVEQIPSLEGYATEQYVEAAVSGKADKTEIPDVSDFVNHSELEDAVDMKMDKSQSADFYPASNPEGYISSIPDEYVTDTEMSSYVLEQTSAYITSEDLPDVSDMATKTWVNEQGYLTTIPSEYVTESDLESAVSGKADKTEIPDVSDMATKTWVSGQGYLTVIPEEYVTSSELSSTSAAIVEEIPEVPTASELAGNGLSAIEDKLVVDKPIPSTSAANNGDVLTYSSDSIVWAPVQGGGGSGSSGGYTVYNVSKTFNDLTPYVEDGETLYALDISVVNHGLYFLDLHTISGETDLKKIRVHIPALESGDYYDIVIQTQMADWSPTYKWEAYCENGPSSESAMTKIWIFDDYRDEFWEDTEFHLFGRHATIMRLEGGAGE